MVIAAAPITILVAFLSQCWTSMRGLQTWPSSPVLHSQSKEPHMRRLQAVQQMCSGQHYCTQDSNQYPCADRYVRKMCSVHAGGTPM